MRKSLVNVWQIALRRVCQACQVRHGNLAVEATVARLPLKFYASLAEMQARREQAGEAMRHAERSGASNRDVIMAKQRSLFSRIEEYYALLSDGCRSRSFSKRN